LRAASEANEPYVKYHALLFLGRAYESLSRIDDARAAYERAASVYIYAQSPRIALSRLAIRRGDMPAAQRYVQQVLRLLPDAPDRGDPFWSYYEGNGRLNQALMSALREAVTALRKPS
jgi:tetratricopeptide (TPR) repeat protein